MRTVYREMTETFVDVLVAAKFYAEHTLKEQQKEIVREQDSPPNLSKLMT